MSDAGMSDLPREIAPAERTVPGKPRKYSRKDAVGLHGPPVVGVR